MSRTLSIIIGILLGALAAAGGLGYFLLEANGDRARLAGELANTTEAVQRAHEQNQISIEEANRKLKAAALEVNRAQQAIKELEAERALLARATLLTPPTSRTIRNWTDAVAVDLGVSIKIPPGSASETETPTVLLARSTSPSSSSLKNTPWLSITSYDQKKEQEALSSLTSSTAVAYAIQGHLLNGYQGYTPGGKPALVLRTQKNGKNSHLLWLREAPGIGQQTDVFIVVLSTLRFAL